MISDFVEGLKCVCTLVDSTRGLSSIRTVEEELVDLPVVVGRLFVLLVEAGEGGFSERAAKVPEMGGDLKGELVGDEEVGIVDELKEVEGLVAICIVVDRLEAGRGS